MFKLGWQVFREQLGEVVDPVRARRAVWLALAVTVLGCVGLVVLQDAFRWAGSGPFHAPVTILLATLGVGLIAFSCCPTARPPATANTINGRQVRAGWQLTVRWSVQPYLGRVPQAVAPDDRAAVLNDVPLLQRGLIRQLSRIGPVLIGFALLGLAALSADGVHAYGLALGLVYVCTLPDLVLRLGRAERARLAALAVTPPDPDAGPAQRRRDPAGSKLRLPGE